MHPPKLVDYRCCPGNVFPPALYRPTCWWTVSDVPDVTNLVSQLDQLCPPADASSVCHLKALALILGERFVVCHLKDNVRHFLAKVLYQLLHACFGIFNRVVQDGRNQDALIVNARFVGQNVGQRNRMIDVR